MQNFTYVDEDTPVKDSLYALIDNQATVASDFAGAMFPTTNLILNQTCFRTDEQKLYRLTAMAPDVWTLQADLAAPQPINMANLPVKRPSLLLDFVNGPKRLPGRVKFSRASTACYYDASGKLVMAEANEPRLDHDPATMARLGLLIEESRTNLLLQSSDLSQAVWNKTNCTVVPAAMLGPDGAMSGSRIDRTAAGNHNIGQTITRTAPGGYTFTFSVWLMGGTMSGAVKLVIKDGADGNIGSSPDIALPAPGVWKRVFFTYKMPAGAANNVKFIVDPVNDAGSAGDYFYLFGAQGEQGTTMSSYIPTTAAAATRAADDAYVEAGAWTAASEGSVYCEGQCVADTSTQPMLWTLRATASNFVQMWATAVTQLVGFQCLYGALFQCSFSTPSSSASPVRAAFGWASNSFVGVVNGQPPVNDNLGTVPSFSSTSELWLGRDVSNSRYLNGYLRVLRYFPKRLTDAELQALTT
ncbi:phage head spike fiber domain-containing protein [Cupriavidus campinensis]|uniref:LamG domain-containing protein n=1 Tax=Cupriavidus campinensis TaxID=151783 RepID=A0ABY3ET54_9BURK|nr:hypothetical protein [Cupriavidus campinensis]TSP13961.1 hypothetical protein FGG12_05680 [Cupriavidus campinensis]